MKSPPCGSAWKVDSGSPEISLTGALCDAEPVHQHLPHVVVHRIDDRVDPLGGVGRVVEPGRSDQHRPAGGHGVHGAKRALLHPGADETIAASSINWSTWGAATDLASAASVR